MALDSPDSGLLSPVLARREHVFEASTRVGRAMGLVALLAMNVLAPSDVLAEEERVSDVDQVSETAEPLRRELIKFLGLGDGDVLNVMTSDQLAKGYWGDWEGALTPVFFEIYKVFKADFPGTVETDYYIRKIGNDFYFSSDPRFLFGEDEATVIKGQGVMNKARFLNEAFKAPSTP